jgi:NAD(P)-dependent dehydrogenase (short-subunit alcohol dehydrogenase family)
MNLNRSVAIVTGSSSGIGLAVARALSARGARVAVVARSADKLSPRLYAKLRSRFERLGARNKRRCLARKEWGTP